MNPTESTVRRGSGTRPDSEEWAEVSITDELAERHGLDPWAERFSLMTAGYRDRLDPEDPNNPEVPFTLLTVAILAEAKARVIARKLETGETGHIHVGGEVRPHTQQFIQIASRVYAAHGFVVHLRQSVRTTPIWYSSFGIYFNNFQGGESFTASHSQFFKGGWKPLDGEGKQLLDEEPEIIKAVRTIVGNRETISLAPWKSEKIVHDFDVDEAYAEYVGSMIGQQAIEAIEANGRRGFRCGACTLGGSMKATTERLFSSLGVSHGADGTVRYVLGEESSEYHRLGHMGDEILGVDPGSPRIYRNVGAEGLLLGDNYHLFLLWDPDGDRIKLITAAPRSVEPAARAAGLEVGETSGDRTIVYFTANQLFFIITAFRIETLRKTGLLDHFDWFVGASFPTTRSIEELGSSWDVPTVRVPVGFKHIGDLCRRIEDRLGDGEVNFEMVTGDVVPLGTKPRALILCEESGGATLGSSEMLRSRGGEREILALREKDGFQIGLTAIALGSMLFECGESFAEYYCRLIEENGIRHIHFKRSDVRLYDEGLLGSELLHAREEGVARRDRIMSFFRFLAEKHHEGGLSLAEAHRLLDTRRSSDTRPIPELARIHLIGDGTLFEGKDSWFIVRASGTDAVMRYYIEGTDPETVQSLEKTLLGLKIR